MSTVNSKTLLADAATDGATAIAALTAIMDGAKGAVTVAEQAANLDAYQFTIGGAVYALVNGWQQAVRDSVAGWANGKDSIKAQIMRESGGDRDRAFRDWATYAGYDVDRGLPTNDAEWVNFTQWCIAKQLSDKATDVYNGDVGARQGGPRRSPEEREKDEIGLMFYAEAISAKRPDGSFVVAEATRKAWDDADAKGKATRVKELRAAQPAFEAKIAAEYTARHARVTDDAVMLASMIVVA